MEGGGGREGEGRERERERRDEVRGREGNRWRNTGQGNKRRGLGSESDLDWLGQGGGPDSVRPGRAKLAGSAQGQAHKTGCWGGGQRDLTGRSGMSTGDVLELGRAAAAEISHAHFTGVCVSGEWAWAVV